jgi:hypothetical protein
LIPSNYSFSESPESVVGHEMGTFSSAPAQHSVESRGCPPLLLSTRVVHSSRVVEYLGVDQRPRKTLDFRCPADVFDEIVALTG